MTSPQRPAARRAPARFARPVEGPQAYPRWYERARAVLGLAGLAGFFGVLLAFAVGVIVLGLAALVDYAISR